MRLFDDVTHQRPPMHDTQTDIDIRQRAVQRMVGFNIRHAQHCWERRHFDPLAPYGLGLLYAGQDPDRPGGWHTVAAASKLWLDGPECHDLPGLLFRLERELRVWPVGRDLRTELANRADDMPADACYIGVGLSSMDTHTGLWPDVGVESMADVPGTILIVLVDGTTILVERRGVAECNERRIKSTHSLGGLHDFGPYPWRWAHQPEHGPDELRADTHHGPILTRLDQLHGQLWCVATGQRAGVYGRR